MQQIKTFLIQAEPAGRTTKDLAPLVDKTVNGWLKENPVENPRVEVAADLSGGFHKAVVVITFEVPQAKKSDKK